MSAVHLERYRTFARALDSQFRIPFTPIRFGWDALIGLLPGAGDAIGGILSAYGLWVGTRLGAPASVLARMLLNLLIDVVIGAVPVLGDLFDVGWKGNLRNLALLERWVETPHQVRRSSSLLIAGLIGAVAIIGLAPFGLIWLLLQFFSCC